MTPITVEQYHQLIQAGILADEPVELLEGWLMLKEAKNASHSTATQLIREVLTDLAPAGWFVNSQEPITTLESEPEPDAAVIRGRRRDFAAEHPEPSDVGLVVEVSDTTLTRDRTLKQRVYARANIPVYWIVNLVDRTVEVYSQPSGPTDQPTYGSRVDYRPADELPLVLDEELVGRIRVSDILP